MISTISFDGKQYKFKSLSVRNGDYSMFVKDMQAIQTLELTERAQAMLDAGLKWIPVAMKPYHSDAEVDELVEYLGGGGIAHQLGEEIGNALIGAVNSPPSTPSPGSAQ